VPQAQQVQQDLPVLMALQELLVQQVLLAQLD